MEKSDIENLKEEASRYALTDSMLKNILDNLSKAIIENTHNIIEANKEDVKINRKQIKIMTFIDIIDSYRDNECILNGDERKMVIYRGDPYITLSICLQAITQRTKVLLLQENFMFGVNEILLKIIDEVLKEYKIYNLITSENNYPLKEIRKITNLFDEIIVIGDTTMYQLLEETEKNVKFYPYNNLGLYCDSDDLEKLQEAIYIYATENQYEIEIIHDATLEEAIYIINSDEQKDVAVLLTRKNMSKEKFEKEIKDKEIFVNDNPFKQELEKLVNYLK